MLAHFSLFGASWTLFFASWGYLGFLHEFLGAPARSKLDFGGLQDGLGRFSEASNRHFSRFLRAHEHALRARFDPYKTLAGAMQIRVRSLGRCTYMAQNSTLARFSCRNCCMDCYWEILLALTWAFRFFPAARRYVRSTWNGAKLPLKLDFPNEGRSRKRS